MSDSQEKRAKVVTITARPALASRGSTTESLKPPSLKSPRSARFAEATSVNSPINGISPFADPPPETVHYMAEPQVADVGFGYVNKHESVEMPNDEQSYPPITPKTPLKSPLKSAMKTPGAAPRDTGKAIFSPTFNEEQILEKREKLTEREQKRDVKIKTRVRMAKILLRGVNFSCSLIVLAMLSTTFTVFNATKDLAPRNNFPPWAQGQKKWPQIVVLSISIFSLFMSILVIYGYWKGGHRKAQKASSYYTAFAVAFFVFSIIMWGIGAGILQGSRNNGQGKDMWGWSCVENTRSQLFQNDVPYQLLCRLQSWSLLCAIIEIVVETITIAVYGIVFYRIYSKHKLRKSMASRDRARSDLYVAHLRSGPNTPAPYSARDGGWKPPVDYYESAPEIEDGPDGTQYVSMERKQQPAPFRLQSPPLKGNTPKMQQVGFTPIDTTGRDPNTMQEDQNSPLMAPPETETRQEHFHAAPGEQVYEQVAIPGAYEDAAPQSPR